MSTMAHPPQMSSHCQDTGIVKDVLYCLASQLWLASLGHGGWLSMLVVVVLGKVIKNLMLSSSSNMHMNQNHVTSKTLTTGLFNSIPDPSIEDIDKKAHSMARGAGGMTRGGGGPSCPSSKLVRFSLLHHLSYILTLLQQKTCRHHLSATLQPSKSHSISGVVGFCWPPGPNFNKRDKVSLFLPPPIRTRCVPPFFKCLPFY